MDCQGNVAYANSTGGITGKQPGRVGDSPLVGTTLFMSKYNSNNDDDDDDSGSGGSSSSSSSSRRRRANTCSNIFCLT